MPVSTQQLDASFQRFLPNFGASLPDQAALERTMLLWAEQFDGQPWVTDAIFQRARNLIIVGHADKYLPTFATVLDYCHAAKDQLERETEHREAEQRVVLPPPPEASEPPATHPWMSQRTPAAAGRDAWERNLAIGAARMRKRKGLIEDWRHQQGPAHDWHTAVPESAWKGLDEPTTAEVEAHLVAMQRTQQSPLAEATAARQQTRRGTGRMRFEWKDGEVSEVTLSQLGSEVPLTERANEPKNKAILKEYDHAPPYNERDYDRDRAKFKAKAAAEAGGTPGA